MVNIPTGIDSPRATNPWLRLRQYLRGLSISEKIIAGFSLPVALMVLVSVLSYRGTLALRDTAAAVTETQAVITQAHLLGKLIVDMETGERGFLITGKDDFLLPFVDAQWHWQENVRTLRERLGDNSVQLTRLGEMDRLAGDWLRTAAQPEIALRRSVELPLMSLDHIERLLQKGTGKDILDGIRALATELDSLFVAADSQREANLLGAAIKSIVDMESGERGFLITGVDSFLGPYRQGQVDYQRYMAQLRAQILTAPDPHQVSELLNAVEGLAQRWVLEAAQPEMQLRASLRPDPTNPVSGRTREQDTGPPEVFSAVEAALNSGAGKRIFDQLRVPLAQLEEIFRHGGLDHKRMLALGLSAAMVAQESAQRGFLLTAEMNYRRDFKAAGIAFHARLKTLRDGVTAAYDAKRALSRLDAIDAAVAAWLSHAQRFEIEARREINRSGLAPMEALQRRVADLESDARVAPLLTVLGALQQGLREAGDLEGLSLLAQLEGRVQGQRLDLLHVLISAEQRQGQGQRQRFDERGRSVVQDLAQLVAYLQSEARADIEWNPVTELAELERQLFLWQQKGVQIASIQGARRGREGSAAELREVITAGIGKALLAQFWGLQAEVLADFRRARNTGAQGLVIALGKALVDQETGQRGYLITGDQRFLEPYEQGGAHFKSLIARLSNIATEAFDPDQVLAELQALELALEQWQQQSGALEIALRGGQGDNTKSLAAIATLFQGGRGASALADIQYRLGALDKVFERSFNQRGQLLLAVIDKAISDMQTGKRGYLITGREEFLAPYRLGEDSIRQYFGELRDLVQAGYFSADMQVKIEGLRELAARWRREAGQPEIQLREALNRRGASMREVTRLIESGTGKQLIDKLRVVLAEFIRYEEGVIASRSVAAEQVAQRAYQTVLWSTVLAVALVCGAAIYLLNTVLNSIKRLERGTHDIAEGDFSVRIEVLSEDVLGQLAQSFNHMAQQLSQVSEQHQEARRNLEHQARALAGAVEDAEQANFALLEQKFAMDQHALVSITDVAGTITFANEKFAEISGYSVDELVGKNHRLLKSERHDEDFFHSLYLAISQGQVWHGEICNRSKADEIYWVKTTIVPFMKEGKAEQYISISSDITANRNTEQHLLEARDVAQRAVEAKAEFLANMSHEIRTPMNGVLGMLGLVLKSELTKDQIKRLAMAQSSAQSLLVIINDILDFSKIEAGKLELEEIVFDLRALLGDVGETMAFKSEEKALAMILDVRAIEHSMVVGDPSRLRQVLNNLVGNAIKFTDKGEIVIKASLEADQDNGNELLLTCSVSDTGVGIPEASRVRIFEAFGQVDSSTTRQYGGTGLGLSIVKQLVDLMGGDVHCSRTATGGSCFEFTVLLGRSEESRLVLPEIDMGALHLLVVDANASNRQVLCEQLSHWGAEVVSSDTGSDVIALLQNRETQGLPAIDVAFIDADLPGLTGAELGAMLQARRTFAAIKLVMMTAITSRGEARHFADMGFSAYFPRPATTSDLFDALAVLVSDDAVLQRAKPLVTQHYLHSLDGHGQAAPTALDDGALEAGRPALASGLTEGEQGGGPFWPPGARILVAEDNYVNQALVCGLLENFGLDFSICNDGQQALDCLQSAGQEQRFTLVLMDCQMPVLDGFAASQAIRAGEAGDSNKTLPIIALTANAMAGDRAKCLEMGMSDYLTKPIDADMLESKLRHWLATSA